MRRFLICAALVAALTGYAPAQSTAPATQPAHAAATPGKIAGVDNFAKISPVLYRGDQPTAEGFATLKKLGVKTIVNLRTFHSDRELLQGTGLQYIQIYAKAGHPETEDLVVFLKVLSDPANQPVFVHCWQGADRTGFMVAAYRVIDEQWTKEEALAELHVFGFHEVWSKVPKAVNELNVKDVLEQIKNLPAPKVESSN